MGPIGGLVDMGKTLEAIVQGMPDAVVGHLGVLERYNALLAGTPYIAHLSASTELGDKQHKVLVGTVERAIKLGADGISVHVNLGTPYDSEMLRDLGKISEDCREWGMPLLAMMYPEKVTPPSVAHAARVAAELGADFVKVPWPGSQEAMKTAVEGCGIPVVVSGGSKTQTTELFKIIASALEAGAKGVALGRNVFQRSVAKEYVIAASKLVKGQYTPDDAYLSLRAYSPRV
jgi:DhnA family fructose-bisphosphate aldolase class Ia